MRSIIQPTLNIVTQDTCVANMDTIDMTAGRDIRAHARLYIQITEHE